MSVGYLFSGVLGHLPLLAVLLVGFVLLPTRRAWLGPRSMLFARLGLGALALGDVLQLAWTLLIPTLFSTLDSAMIRYNVLFSLIGLVTSLLSAAGVALLIAALLARSPGAAFAGQQPAGGPPSAGPEFFSGQSFGGGPPAGPQSGNSDPPTGPPFSG